MGATRVPWIVLLLALGSACGGDGAPAQSVAVPRDEEVARPSRADRLASAWFELHELYSPLARPIGLSRLGQGDRVSVEDRAAIAAASRLARELLVRERETIERVAGAACAAETAHVDAREDGRVVMDTLALFEESLGAGFLPDGATDARCAAVRVEMAGAWTEHLWTLQGRDRQAAIEARVGTDPEIADLARRTREVSAPFTASMTGGPRATRAQVDALADLAEELDIDDGAVAALRAMDPDRPGMPPPWMPVIASLGSAVGARAATDVPEGAETRRVRELYEALRRGWREAIEHGRTHELPSADGLPFDPPPSLTDLASACAGEPVRHPTLTPEADSCVRAPR